MRTREMVSVLRVKPLRGYKLRLKFSDGIWKVIDLKPLLWGYMFSPMKDLSEFREVRVNKDFGCLEWPNGADLCPDALRYHWREVKKSSEENRIKHEANRSIKRTGSKAPIYSLKTRPKKSGPWKCVIFGHSLKSLERAAWFHRNEYGGETKIVRLKLKR